ncbi:glutamate synthase (ferredoxin) [Sporobacter termitidis DSM 10068]|uniref:Glutamate synthase (Ferredoxin) n=1 Tax=Sporobacter termitidis DSM 10068 TaxID=1123282 RepID=A0A1M5Z6T6_9FIRM|nr:glutamate synthase (ferredoxin) [Sporobacter termitidis DSM 10068]
MPQGLYDPRFEHDACGIGFIANIKGEKSNLILRQALTALKNLSHRGGLGSEPTSGDGAGILFQIPHVYYKKVCSALGITLPAAGDYGTGIVFLPHDTAKSAAFEKEFAAIVKDEGQTLLGLRDVPVDASMLGATAKSSMPSMRQIFIGRNGVNAGLDFERRLYIIRRRIENAVHKANPDDCFYLPSLSSRTIVYKGMLTAEQLDEFYIDLQDESVVTALALVHSRYSTNTFPSWERAHPNRCIIHNGEINTLRGNVNYMDAREAILKSDAFGDDLKKALPIIDKSGSDSSMFDNTAEFLMLSGMPIERVMMLMVPEPWVGNESMSEEQKAFYEYSACLMEPWDGPAAMGFTDGVRIGATLDRNGLRPSRYYVTTDGTVVLASEVGVLNIPPEKVVKKERLHPGRMLLIDTEAGRIIEDEEIKNAAAASEPYGDWLKKYLVDIDQLPTALACPVDTRPLLQLQRAFGYSYEDLRMFLAPMVATGVDPVGAMGNDTPLAVLSKKPMLLYEYFKQLFAQVTNPPIDALREALITSSVVFLGSESNILKPGPDSCRRIKLHAPVIGNDELAKLKTAGIPGFKSETLPIVFKAGGGGKALRGALDALFEDAAKAIDGGANILILSDRSVDETHAAIPALLAVGGLHHYLIRAGLRTKASIVLESGEPREIHHFSCLIGYGAAAVNPYIALESVAELVRSGYISGYTEDKAVHTYIKVAYKGVIKVLSKMGISTIQSYMGAQIFEALGIGKEVIDKYFTMTPARIGGVGLEEIAKEAEMRHAAAFKAQDPEEELDTAGNYQYRRNGEYHIYNPETIDKLQRSTRTGDYALFKEYARLINENEREHATLRSAMKFKKGTPVPLDEVEPVESIVKRFKTGAMSFGSISKEAHEAMAVAMNRLGGKSNTGEGGEDPARYKPDANGDSRCSAVKQVASGRFGVTSEYLVNSKEIQIKMAQGAKPGEGGQLPGRKVYPEVAKVRYSTPGVGLISPPPHHDIYSIEDLKELIYDLKNSNPQARINVKLVSEAGVGTVAAGVAKGFADVVLVSGYDGGTGASPRTSMRHAGLPWELGLAETHQTLVLNNLRNRIVIETDGKLMTGRDVAVAALLGAEEYGFATAPLVTLGCVMMRVCNMDTCPVGVATNNPALRAKFTGKPEYVMNFMKFVAAEMREYMAEMGFRTVNEMIGRADMLEPDIPESSWKAGGLDLSAILYKPEVPEGTPLHQTIAQNHGLESTVDMTVLLNACRPALENGEKVETAVRVKNTDRAIGTILGSCLTRKYGESGLPDDTIRLNLTGSSGQSLGAFVPKGVTITLTGDSNDYTGKGLSGGKIIVRPPKEATFNPEENIIIGNVAFYGATSGEAYIRGAAGERFCVRNSGAVAVVEAVGDHGCEYMTGGRVVVLGKTGRNFAAGMSGGIAYVYDEDGTFATRCNTEMVKTVPVDGEGAAEIKKLVAAHLEYTGSEKAAAILKSWDSALAKFVCVMPNDYERMIKAIKKAHEDGYTGDAALMIAFDANNRDVSRLSGN